MRSGACVAALRLALNARSELDWEVITEHCDCQKRPASLTLRGCSDQMRISVQLRENAHQACFLPLGCLLGAEVLRKFIKKIEGYWKYNRPNAFQRCYDSQLARPSRIHTLIQYSYWRPLQLPSFRKYVLSLSYDINRIARE